MKSLPRFLALGATFGFAVALSAQPPANGPRGPHGGGPGGPRGPGRHPGNPIVRVIDTDKDGTISAAELTGASAAILTLDSNGNGVVSADEMRPPRPADATLPPADAPVPPDGVTPPPHPEDPVMLALDANGDGELSAAEIANAATSLKALDLNADGQLTPDELRPLPPEGAPVHDGPPPRD